MARPIQADGRMHGVAVGVRDGQGRWLMVRRSANVTSPLKVCFPGGAVEVGESQEEAVVREMREELGVEVRPVGCVWKWAFPDRAVTLWGWEAELVSSPEEVRADEKEIAEVLWMTGEEGGCHVDGLPTNCLFIEALGRGRGELPTDSTDGHA